jgi:hypothetical protein
MLVRQAEDRAYRERMARIAQSRPDPLQTEVELADEYTARRRLNAARRNGGDLRAAMAALPMRPWRTAWTSKVWAASINAALGVRTDENDHDRRVGGDET